MDYKEASATLSAHFKETFAIWHMADKHFKKFYKTYMGESLADDEVFEARILLVKMILDTMLTDCEVIVNEIKKAET